MTWFLLSSLSAILSATAAIIQKKILFRLHALEFSFFVSVLVLLFTLFVPFSIDVASIPQATFLLLIGKSVLGGFAFLLVMMSLQYNQISSALPLLGTTPALTALLAIPILGESLHNWEWIGIGLMMCGTYLLEKRPAQNIMQPFKEAFLSRNHYYIFGAVGLFAISSLADKMLTSGLQIDPLVVLFYQHIVYCALFATLLLIRRSSVHIIVQKGKTQIMLVTVVALLTLAYRFAQLEATKMAPIALVLAIKRTSILYASFFGGKLFSDDRLAIKLIGGVLIVAAGFIILRTVA